MNKYELPKRILQNERRETKYVGFRLKSDTLELLENYARQNNMTKTKIVEIAIKNLKPQ